MYRLSINITVNKLNSIGKASQLTFKDKTPSLKNEGGKFIIIFFERNIYHVVNVLVHELMFHRNVGSEQFHVLLDKKGLF